MPGSRGGVTDLYEVLEIERDATEEQIKKAYVVAIRSIEVLVWAILVATGA